MTKNHQSSKLTKKNYDLVIIGAGITGTALLYTLTNYTNINSIALIEKYQSVAPLNSNSNNNSQTLHFGDIESNYSFEKAKIVSQNAELVAGFLENHAKQGYTYYKKHKLLLAIGTHQINTIKKRVTDFKSIFPNIKLINKKQIQELEPLICEGRNQNEQLAALYSPDGYAIDYGRLSELFVEKTIEYKKKCLLNKLAKNKIIDIQLSTKIQKIKQNSSGYCLSLNHSLQNHFPQNHAASNNSLQNNSYSNKSKLGQSRTQKQTINAKVLLVCAGAHSLILAKQVGVGKEIGILPVSGTFFSTTRKVLNGKVYTIQTPKLPFAAIHGDPNVNNPNETRFGPTARVYPILEKAKFKTFPDFLKTSAFTLKGIASLIKVIADPTIFMFTLKNILYDVPIIGKRFILKEVKKIIPSLRLNELDYSKKIGGIRPQIINTKTKKLVMGQGKLYTSNAIFNITPSPGASNCLANARDDALKIQEFLGPNYSFDVATFEKDNKR